MNNPNQESRTNSLDYYVNIDEHETDTPPHTTQEKCLKLSKTFAVTVAAAASQTLSQCSSVLVINAIDPVFKPHIMLEVIAIGHLEVSSLIVALANMSQIPNPNPHLCELFITALGTCMIVTGITGITVGELTLSSPVRQAFLKVENLNELPFQCYDSKLHPNPHFKNKGNIEDFYARLSGFGFGTSIALPIILMIGCGIISIALACKYQVSLAAQEINTHVRNSVTYLRGALRRVANNDVPQHDFEPHRAKLHT